MPEKEKKMKRIVRIKDEEALVKLILDFSREHQFTKTNILESVNKAMDYMDDNALLEGTQSYMVEPLRQN